MKLTISTSQNAVKDAGNGGNFISTEGIYPVRIDFVSIQETRNGAKEANFNITYKDNTQTLYGLTIVNKDGNMNEIGMQLLNKLGVLCGMTEGDDLNIEQESHKVGKDSTVKEFDVITNFSDFECYMRIQREYTKYNGEIRSNLLIRNVFRAEDGASAAEIVNAANGNQVEFGKQMKLEEEKYTSSPVYRDGVTAEEAEAFEQQKRNGKGKAGAAATTATSSVGAVTGKRTSLFGNKP